VVEEFRAEDAKSALVYEEKREKRYVT